MSNRSMNITSIKILIILSIWTVIGKGVEISTQKRKHVICYHGTWATYRKSAGKFDIANIDPFLCTHVMYAFFGIEIDGSLRIIDPYLDLEDNWGRGNIRAFNALKLQNPTLKTLLAVGGWNEGSKNFSIVANDPERRARFVNSAVQFVQRHGFDGLDLDWEYPNQRHNLTDDDKSNFVTLLRELREGLDPYGYMLTAAVGSVEFSAKLSYDIPEVVKYLDLINVMAYDLHGPWENVTGINAPLYAGVSDTSAHAKQFNVDAIVKYWLEQGAPREKLLVGVPFYGRSFTLADAAHNIPGSPHLGRGLGGQYSVEPGVIGYNELCEKLLIESWTVKWEEDQMVPYAYLDRQWIGFEAPRSIELKAQFVADNDLAGIMIWSIESDDFQGKCGQEQYPLLKTINRALFGLSTPSGLTQAPKLAPNAVHIPTSVPELTHALLSSARPKFTCQVRNRYVRDAQDCRQFYYCDGASNAHSFTCPQGLWFDLGSLSCNYVQDVQC